MSTQQKTILIIDDEMQIRRFLRISLQSQGYAVCEAENGRTGLELAALNSPALIVLDLGLPDMDGTEVLAELRHWSAAPVVILSVRDSEGEKVLALDRGANDYITKPFGIREFLARVRNLLRTPAPDLAATAGTVTLGPLHIDFGTRRVSLDGRPVRLTPKEYAVLEKLAKNPGRVITQTQLLTELWGPTHAHNTHYLRVVIGRLRQKLGDDPGEPRFLATEPGVGYRFTDEPPDLPGT